MRRPLSFLLSSMFAFSILAAGSLATSAPASAATIIAPTTYCGNSILNTGGRGLICEVTVVNSITPAGGSATVTVRECQGAADAETACTIRTTVLTSPVTGVNQCNGSINGGGGTLRCSVRVTNNFYGLTPAILALTVNQCVGSGDGVANDCDPFPATTSGATITQCNGSANGGTLVQLECTVTGTRPSVRGVRVNQCNSSANGGGALVICSTNIENNVLGGSPPPVVTAAPTPTRAPGATPRRTTPPTNTGGLVDQPGGMNVLIVPGLMFLFALALITTARRKAR